MAYSNSILPFNIGNYIIIDELEYSYVTDIYDDLRLITSFNVIDYTTRTCIIFSSCYPTTMVAKTRLRSGNNRHTNTIRITPISPLISETPIRRTPLDRLKAILNSHPLVQYMKDGNKNKEKGTHPLTTVTR